MKTTEHLPLISICVPTFNGAQYIQECLNSISIQKYTNIEVIISDDSSNDETLTICSHFKKSVSFPVFIHTHIRNGMANNWNNCIEKSNGTFIKFLFQDDVLAPGCLEKFVQNISLDHHHQFIFCNRSFILEDELANNKEIQNWIKRYSNLAKGWKFNLAGGIDGKKLLKKSDNLFSYPLNKIGEPSVTFFSKSLFEKNGLFDPQFIQLTDVELYYRLMPHCHFSYLDEKLIKIRLHKQQTTSKNLENSRSDEDLLLYYVLKNRIKELLHPNTLLFPIKYKWKKRIKRLLRI